MTDAVMEIRAMLALFVRSSGRDLHVRTGGWELFFARPDGAANPMVTSRTGTVDADEALNAPHLGLFFAQVEAGAHVAAGSVIGQIEVLDEREDLVADRAGRVSAILVEDGALVEYDTPLVRLAA